MQIRQRGRRQTNEREKLLARVCDSRNTRHEGSAKNFRPVPSPAFSTLAQIRDFSKIQLVVYHQC